MKTVKLLHPLLICIVISFLGCSGQSPTVATKGMAPPPTADEMNMGDGAALYILNLSGWTLIPQDQMILDNGRKLVSLPRNTYARFIIPAGSHEFGFPYRKDPTLKLEAVKGETYYLRVVHEARTSWAYSIEGDPIELTQLTRGEAWTQLEKLEPHPVSANRETEPAAADEKQVTKEDAGPMMETPEPNPSAVKEEVVSPPAEQDSAEKAAPAVKANEPSQTPAAEIEPVIKKQEPSSMKQGRETASIVPAGEMKTADKATLFIFNLSGWTLLSGNQTVLDNGEELVNIPRNTYTKVLIPAGKHELGFKNREEPRLDLDVAMGETYYVSFAYQQKSSWISTTKTDPIKIRQLSEDEARQLIKRITFYH